MTKKFSKRGELNKQDWLNGLYLAILTGALTSIQQIASTDLTKVGWSTLATIAGAAITTGTAYLIKKLNEGTPTEIEVDPAVTKVTKVKR